MATHIWVNIGSGNGLLSDGTKELPVPMMNAILKEIPQPSVTEISLKITNLNFNQISQGPMS